jgi:hypothetical protein
VWYGRKSFEDVGVRKMKLQRGGGDVVEASELLEGCGRDAAFMEETLRRGWRGTGAGIIAGPGANAQGIPEGAVQSGLESFLNFGGGEIAFIVEEIVGLGGGFARRVEGNGDGKEGDRLIVVVVNDGVGIGIFWLRDRHGLRVSASGQEEAECCAQEEYRETWQQSPGGLHECTFLAPRAGLEAHDGRDFSVGKVKRRARRGGERVWYAIRRVGNEQSSTEGLLTEK